MTFKIFNPVTNKVIDRSNVRAADEPDGANHRADYLAAPEVITSLKEEPISAVAPDDTTSSPAKRALSILDSSDLVGRTFLLDKEDGQRLRS